MLFTIVKFRLTSLKKIKQSSHCVKAMGFATPGKRKFMNTSLNSSSTKSSKRSAQTISGLMNSANNHSSVVAPSVATGGSSNTRSANKRVDGQQAAKEVGKKVANYAKTHIKNNVEFMQKSSRLNSTASSKFLSSKLRCNSSTFMNSVNAENNSSGANSDAATPASRAKKQLISEQQGGMDMANRSSELLLHQQSHSYSRENLLEQEAMYCRRLAEFRYRRR